MNKRVSEWNLVIGIIIIIINIYWGFLNVRLFYLYNFTEIVFAFTTPNWVLILNIISGIIGIIIGINVFRNKWSVKKGGLYAFLLILIGFSLDQLIVSL
jgi:hypothetical protein